MYHLYCKWDYSQSCVITEDQSANPDQSDSKECIGFLLPLNVTNV